MDNLGVFDAQRWLPEESIWWACIRPVSSAAQIRSIIPVLDKRVIRIQGLIVPSS